MVLRLTSSADLLKLTFLPRPSRWVPRLPEYMLSSVKLLLNGRTRPPRPVDETAVRPYRLGRFFAYYVDLLYMFTKKIST